VAAQGEAEPRRRVAAVQMVRDPLRAILRDHPGPTVARRLPWSVRARHALGLPGRSVAVRGAAPPAVDM
jgi:hypothetical protein